jgi:tetratricopeptide (TPR) repeat protein
MRNAITSRDEPRWQSEEAGERIGRSSKLCRSGSLLLLVVLTSSSFNLTTLLINTRYLYERESYNKAQDLIQVAFQHFPDKEGLAYAGALDLRGLIYLGTNHPARALEDFTAALIVRQQDLGSDDALIGSSLNNLGLAYTETNDLAQAKNFHDQAIELRLRINSERIGDSYGNMSSTLLRLGRPDEAEDMFFRRPSSKNFDDETNQDTGNPRLSGDLVLLSRIRRQQGRLDDALHLASKALSFRQSVLGNTPKTCDAMYLIADLLHRKDKIATARTLLYECITVAAGVPEAPGYLAKAQYKLGMLYILDGDLQGGAAYINAARSNRDVMLGHTTPVEREEGSFEKLVPWMLW